MFAKEYELQIIEKRLRTLTNGEPEVQEVSREDFIESLIWLDEQEEIDKEIASGAKAGSPQNS